MGLEQIKLIHSHKMQDAQSVPRALGRYNLEIQDGFR